MSGIQRVCNFCGATFTGLSCPNCGTLAGAKNPPTTNPVSPPVQIISTKSAGPNKVYLLAGIAGFALACGTVFSYVREVHEKESPEYQDAKSKSDWMISQAHAGLSYEWLINLIGSPTRTSEMDYDEAERKRLASGSHDRVVPPNKYADWNLPDGRTLEAEGEPYIERVHVK